MMGRFRCNGALVLSVIYFPHPSARMKRFPCIVFIGLLLLRSLSGNAAQQAAQLSNDRSDARSNAQAAPRRARSTRW
jgi:hypothetical protein